MKKILVLSSDTPHHRYFINTLIKNGIVLSKCIFETSHVSPPFKTGPLFDDQEDDYERKHFFNETDHHLPEGLVTLVQTVNSEAATQIIEKVQPDFGLVFGTGLIKPGVIKLFTDGLVNVHRGIAPRYRGLDSDLWAIYHNDYANIGVTIHRVDPELDTGGIVYQRAMSLIPKMKIHQIRYNTTVIATDLMLRTVRDYLGRQINYVEQQKMGRYYSFMPLELKKIVQKKFNSYCERLDESTAC